MDITTEMMLDYFGDFADFSLQELSHTKRMYLNMLEDKEKDIDGIEELGDTHLITYYRGVLDGEIIILKGIIKELEELEEKLKERCFEI